MAIKKIILCCNSAAALKNFRFNTIKFLLKNSYRVVIVAPDDTDLKPFEKIGAKFITWKVDPRGSSVISEFLSSILASQSSDLNIFYTIKPIIYGNLINILLQKKVLNIVTGLGYIFIERNKLNFFIQKLLAYCFGIKTHTWCLNKDDMNLLVERKFVFKERISILPGEGVDTNYYKPGKKVASEILTFLMVSRVIKEKGVKEFALAAKYLKKTGLKARFILIGEYQQTKPNAIEPHLMREWIERNIIEYKGLVEDVRPYIKSCDCLVLPSYREGLPRSLLEAFSMKKLAVASDVPGCRQLVKEGETGFLCQARNVKSLIAALKKFISLDLKTRRNLEKEARNKVVLYYSDEHIFRNYKEFLESN